MEEDRFYRKTEGKLPEAEFVNLEEIFKCNEPTLNMLLSVLQERVFYNDGKPVSVPLITLFASSNELPEEGLEALYDRLLFRMYVEYIKDPSNKQKMFKGYLNKRAGAESTKYTTITLQEINALNLKSTVVKIDKIMLDTFGRLLRKLENKGLVVSDRRQNECLKILQGNAVLNDRNEVILDDLEALVYVLWDKKDDIPTIISEINLLINRFEDELIELNKTFRDIRYEIERISDKQKKCEYLLKNEKAISSLTNKYTSLVRDAKKNCKNTEKIEKAKLELIEWNKETYKSTMGFELIPGGKSPYTSSMNDPNFKI